MTLKIPVRKTTLHTVGVLLLVLAVLPFALFAVPQLGGVDQSHVVMSDSMSPTISAGDVIFVEKTSPAEIQTGDIITYDQQSAPQASPNDPHIVTHRVIEITEEDGERVFRTQGDANTEPDSEPVPEDDVIGKVAFTIPYIGYLIVFAGTWYGTLMFVVLPLLLLAVLELRDLYKTASTSRESNHE